MVKAQLIFGFIIIILSGQFVALLFWWVFDWNCFVPNLFTSVYLIILQYNKFKKERDSNKQL